MQNLELEFHRHRHDNEVLFCCPLLDELFSHSRKRIAVHKMLIMGECKREKISKLGGGARKSTFSFFNILAKEATAVAGGRIFV